MSLVTQAVQPPFSEWWGQNITLPQFGAFGVSPRRGSGEFPTTRYNLSVRQM